MINTVCRDCVFAEYSNKVQYGCALSRLERFSKNGSIKRVQYKAVSKLAANLLGYKLPEKENLKEWLIYENHDDQYEFVKDLSEEELGLESDLDKTFYKIDRFCTTCRSKDSDWAKEIPEDEWVARVKEDIKLQLTTVFYFDNNETLEDLEKVVKSALTQEHLPCEIIILNCNTDINQGKQISRMFDRLEVEFQKEFETVAWKQIVPISPSMSENININHLIKVIKGTYFSLSYPCCGSLQPDFIKKIHVALNERLERFVMLCPSEFNETEVYQTYLFNVLEGNKSKILEKDKPPIEWFLEKVKYIEDFNKEYGLIKSIEDV